MYISTQDKALIEALLNDGNTNSIEQLKKTVAKYNGPTQHSCFCKSANKVAYLNKVREWYIQQND